MGLPRTHCQYFETTDTDYKEFYKISDLTGIRTDENTINLPFYVQAAHDGYIVFTKEPTSKDDQPLYEIGNYNSLKNNKFH